ncbi:MAG: MATE family efflux transporter [Deinococcota bacterium]
MTKTASALRNGLWNSLSRIVLGAAQILGSILIVRSLATEQEYGVFSYYAWLAGILSTLGVLAFPNSLTKVVSELRGANADNEAKALVRWLFICLVGLNIVIGLIFVGRALAAPLPERHYLLVVALVPLSNVLVRMFSSLLWGYEQYRPISIATTFAGIGQFLLIVVAFIADWGVAGYLVAVVLSMNVFIPILLFVTKGRQPIVEALSVPHWPSRKTLAHYFDFFKPAALIIVFDAIVWQRSEVFFLERYSTDEQIGFYSLAFSVIAIFISLGYSLINGYYPSISREYGAGNWTRIRQQISQAMLLAVIYATPLLFGGWVTIEKLTEVLYGARMVPMVEPARVLFLGLVPATVAGVFGLTIGALSKVWLQVRIGVVLAIFNIVLDFVLIMWLQLGAFGAAIANTSTQLTYVVWLYIVVRGLSGVSLPWRPIGAIVGIGFVTTYLVPLFIQQWLPGVGGLVVAIVVSAVCYAGSLWASGLASTLVTRVPRPSFAWYKSFRRVK